MGIDFFALAAYTLSKIKSTPDEKNPGHAYVSKGFIII